MTAKDINTEIELLKLERKQMAKDITDLKDDVRAIKTFLMGSETEEPKVVTKKEFEAYRSSNTLSRWIVGIVTSVLTAFITYEILRQLGK